MRLTLFFIIVSAIVVYGCAPKAVSGKSETKISKPNIIFILADDLGYGDIGVNGQQKIETPNIDKLAYSGMQFTNFYCGTAVCAPSRSSLMTGQHTGHTPIRGNKSWKPEGQWPLPETAKTVANMLKNAGYVTGDFGKWGLGFIGTGGDPNKKGFDTFYGYNCQSLAHDYFPDHLWQNATKIDLPNTKTNQVAYSADMIHRKALHFIQQNSKTPFFLFLSYTLPHAALQIPASDPTFEKYKKRFNETPKKIAEWNGRGYQPQAYPHAAYATMVTYLDNYVGDVVGQLRELGIEKNTIVFFASDNGPHREGGNDPEFFNSSGGYRGIKRALYEGGIKTPFIVSWPGTIKAGSKSDHIGAFWDVMPTLGELSGSRSIKPTDGISFVPALVERSQKPHNFLYWEFHEEGGRQAVRMGKWKGVRQNVFKDRNGPIELYNLETDKKEQHDVARENLKIVRKMRVVMKRQHVEEKDFPFWRRPANQKDDD